ncbi:IS30 family transposase [Paenibacillus sp. JGP012]|nr:IS30 family transposase [Paenibacillus sp. JGP012]
MAEPFQIVRKKSVPANIWALGTGYRRVRSWEKKGCVATLIERKTRLYTAILMPDRTALSMEIALGVAISQYPTGTFLTATVDRGKEFAGYANTGNDPWPARLFC